MNYNNKENTIKKSDVPKIEGKVKDKKTHKCDNCSKYFKCPIKKEKIKQMELWEEELAGQYKYRIIPNEFFLMSEIDEYLTEILKKRNIILK